MCEGVKDLDRIEKGTGWTECEETEDLNRIEKGTCWTARVPGWIKEITVIYQSRHSNCMLSQITPDKEGVTSSATSIVVVGIWFFACRLLLAEGLLSIFLVLTA
jgi:hypothetical protein